MVRVSTRTLVILRHAKAANPTGVADKDRPLNHRGEADAVAAGAWLAEHGYAPDVVVCSPARRTRQTWHGVAQSLTAAPTVSYVERLYGAPVDNLLAVIAELDDNRRTALLIGHNPGVSQLSAELDPSAADSDGLSTSGIAVHTWDGEWSDCGPGSAALTASHTARG
jgi:phosphohistidine phosphatase